MKNTYFTRKHRRDRKRESAKRNETSKRPERERERERDEFFLLLFSPHERIMWWFPCNRDKNTTIDEFCFFLLLNTKQNEKAKPGDI